MKLIFALSLISFNVYSQSAPTVTISGRTGTGRTSVTFSGNFRPVATTSTTSSTSTSSSTTTTINSDRILADLDSTIYVAPTTDEIRTYTPREIGYVEPVTTYPVMNAIDAPISTDATVLSATRITSWSPEYETSPYYQPIAETAVFGGATFSGTTIDYTATSYTSFVDRETYAAPVENISAIQTEWQEPVRTDYVTPTTTTTSTTTTSTTSTTASATTADASRTSTSSSFTEPAVGVYDPAAVETTAPADAPTRTTTTAIR